MSSKKTSDKRTPLETKIELEISRGPESSDEGSCTTHDQDPLSLLLQVVEQAEKLERATSTATQETSSYSAVKHQLTSFKNQNSALKRLLSKMH